MKKNITADKYKAEVNKVRSAMMNVEESKKQNECAMKKCKAEFISFLNTFIATVKKECSASKKQETCDILKEFETIKKRARDDKLTHDDIKVLAEKLTKL